MSAPLPKPTRLTTNSPTLSELAPGDSGTISAISGSLSIRRRLLEMGLCPGIQASVIRRAPLGDPIEIRVRGYCLSLRLDQAAQISIAVTQPAMVATR
jgi:Fe2+ transport system protein FeoA